MSPQRTVRKASTSTESARPPLSKGRIVVKAGTSLLTGGTDRLDGDVMASLVAQVAELRSRGSEMILVSSGAVAALAAVALVAPLGSWYLAGVAGVALLLAYEQSLVRPDDLSRVKQAFDGLPPRLSREPVVTWKGARIASYWDGGTSPLKTSDSVPRLMPE